MGGNYWTGMGPLSLPHFCVKAIAGYLPKLAFMFPEQVYHLAASIFSYQKLRNFPIFLFFINRLIEN